MCICDYKSQTHRTKVRYNYTRTRSCSLWSMCIIIVFHLSHCHSSLTFVPVLIRFAALFSNRKEGVSHSHYLSTPARIARLIQTESSARLWGGCHGGLLRAGQGESGWYFKRFTRHLQLQRTTVMSCQRLNWMQKLTMVLPIKAKNNGYYG